jgi:hypothetical protein
MIIQVAVLVLKKFIFNHVNIFSLRMAEQKRMARWYFGGLASAGAACITHPLDLLKV